MAAACVAITTLAYTVEAVGRYVFSAPLNWSDDIGSYLLCAGLFLALPKITLARSHVALSMLEDGLSGSRRDGLIRFLAALAAAGCMIAAAFMVVEGMRQYDLGILTSLANQIPKWWLSAACALGLASSSIHLLDIAFFGTPAETVGGGRL
jgi:TRAP-type C4-dicarboxylate transport system permease small subunit